MVHKEEPRHRWASRTNLFKVLAMNNVKYQDANHLGGLNHNMGVSWFDTVMSNLQSMKDLTFSSLT